MHVCVCSNLAEAELWPAGVCVYVMLVVSELPRVNDCLIKYFNDNIVRIKRELITHLLTLMRN